MNEKAITGTEIYVIATINYSDYAFLCHFSLWFSLCATALLPTASINNISVCILPPFTRLKTSAFKIWTLPMLILPWLYFTNLNLLSASGYHFQRYTCTSNLGNLLLPFKQPVSALPAPPPPRPPQLKWIPILLWYFCCCDSLYTTFSFSFFRLLYEFYDHFLYLIDTCVALRFLVPKLIT